MYQITIKPKDMSFKIKLNSTDYWKVEVDAFINAHDELTIVSIISEDHWVDSSNENVPVESISDEDVDRIYTACTKEQKEFANESKYGI